MDFWDLRRLQPMTIPGAVPSFATAVPELEALKQAALANPDVQHRWDPNAKPGPQPTLDDQLKTLQRPEHRGIIAGSGVTPPPRPPSLTMFRGLPLGPQTKEAVITPPPSVPATGPATSPIPLLGPGVSTPAITGAPIRPVMPGTEFGDPATREAIRTTPNTPAKGPYDDIYEMAKRGDFNGAITKISKAMGNRKGVAAPESHAPQIGPGNPGFHQVNTQGEMDKFMAGLTSRLAQQAWEKKAANRRRQQERYDFNALEGRG
jgi:hypothetical protein